MFPPGLWSTIRPRTVAVALQREAEMTPCLGLLWDDHLHGELLLPLRRSLARVYAEGWPGTVPALQKLLMETKDFPPCEDSLRFVKKSSFCCMSEHKFSQFLHEQEKVKHRAVGTEHSSFQSWFQGGKQGGFGEVHGKLLPGFSTRREKD